ncbi:MAG: substrate-binding domain-containing protein [Devosia sp.]
MQSKPFSVRNALLAGTSLVLAGAMAIPAFADAGFLDRMKADVAAATAPGGGAWDGPTSGPKAVKDKTVVFVSLTQNSSGNNDASKGAGDAAKALGWKYSVIDGKGNATDSANALQQAIALKPDGIILGSIDPASNKAALDQAAAAGIKIVSWHSTSTPGPVADSHIFVNVSTPPDQIAYLAGEYAVVHSNGKAKAEVISDRQYQIVVTKSDAIEKAIKECDTCQLLSEDNGPFGEVPQRTPSLTNSLLQKYGKDLGYMLTFNDVYFDFVVPTLKSAGIEPGSPPYLISAGDGSESAYQRIRTGQFQIATVPEPAYMHGWQLIDELNRAFNDQQPSGYVTKVHLVTKDNIDADGGKDNRYDPQNGYQDQYKKIWGVEM